MVTVICSIKNIHFLCTKVLGFVSCRVTSKVLGIGASERSWDDVNTINYRKISSISSYVSEKQSIVYTSACIESDIIEQYYSDKKLNDNCSSHTWNEEDDDFDQQFKKWGVEKVFSYQSQPIKIGLRSYIED